MRCLVVGAGAWGLPAAAELAVRGHDVTLIDRFGPANRWSSSPGPTRIWRIAHPDEVRARLAVRAVEAMERLARDTDTTVFLRRGLLWRDDETVDDVARAVRAAGEQVDEVDADEVGRFLPGLRPDGRRAVFQPAAGPVLAAASMQAQLGRFESAGGQHLDGVAVRSVQAGPDGPTVELSDGSLTADVVVLAPGPGAAPLLSGLGMDLPLRPRLEQAAHVAHVQGTELSDTMPCWFDGPTDGLPALYAMATPGVGYKLGLDRPVRAWRVDDLDRTPDAATLEELADRVRRCLDGVHPEPFDAQVCSWTESPDNRFIIDSLPGGVVVACGDGGEGFKFSALMGTVLADLAEGRRADDDVATFGLARFADGVPDTPHVLGR